MLQLGLNGIDLGRGRGGNESYLEGIVAGLSSEPRVQTLNVLTGQHFSATTTHPKVHYIPVGVYRRVPYLLWQQSLVLRRLSCDWFLSTFFLPALTPHRAAVFAHDFSFLAWPQAYPLSIRWYMRVLVGWAIRRADKVIVLSEFVRAELERFYPQISTTRVAVVYPGISRDFSITPLVTDSESLERYGLQAGYILSVSNIHPRKNLSGLLQAYQQLKARLKSRTPPLVIVGETYWGSTALRAQMQTLQVRPLGYVPQADLPALYRAASVLVYPSLYEGFGLPTVEAMASGTPVICDNQTSLPEAVGDAALMVNAREVEQMAESMEHVLIQPTLRASLIERGLRQAQKFDWRESARQLVSCLIE